MRWLFAFLAIMLVASVSGAQEFTFQAEEGHLDLMRNGRPWLRTLTPAYDAEAHEVTFKVYTHIFDAEGAEPITKGEAGRFCHHRGLFIGWSQTRVTDAETGETAEFDTWQMTGCHQAHHSWLGFGLGGEGDDSLQFHLVARRRVSQRVIDAMDDMLHGAVEALLLPPDGDGGPRILRANIDGFRQMVAEAERQPGLMPSNRRFAFLETAETHQGQPIHEVFLIETPAAMTAEGMLLRAVAERDAPQWSVLYDAPPPIAERLGDLSEAHIGRRLAIRFGDRVLSAPRIESRLASSGRITGAFTQQDAERIAASGHGHAVQEQEIHWNDGDGEPFIREVRTITAWQGANGRYIIDFVSQLEALRGPVQFRGDSHHGGMQIRLSDEVSQHEDTTEFILPEGAERLPNDEVSGAWWATCRADVGGRTYWVQHMTAPGHPGGEPLYSIRPYARFGAFTQPDLDPETPLTFRYRLVVSEEELDREASEALYQEYLAR